MGGHAMSTRVNPSVATAGVAIPARRATFGDLLNRENSLGLILMLPAMAILVTFIAYPFFLGIWYALTNARIGVPGVFVGIDNFIANAQNGIFQQTLRNTWAWPWPC
jgi:multiple sugar transport system permease protein